MTTSTISEKQANIILTIFCILHVMLLSFSSELFRNSVTHDTLEGIAWGYQWQLGYSKHPFIAAWLTALATKLGKGYVGLPVYLLSQLAVITAFVANYKLAKKILPISQALISVLLLEGIIYFNINSINFTPDTAQTPFWALTALIFFNALTTQRILPWIFTAILVAICILTKYSAIFLILPMILVCVLTKVGRKSFRNKYFYVAIIILFIFLAPHLYWTYKQGFTGFQYINSSLVDSENALFTHLYYPFTYLKGQALIALGMIILAWPLWPSWSYVWYSGFKSNKHKYIEQDTKVLISSFHKHYILLMGLGPILLTVLYAAISGKHILQRWSTPYYYIAGITFLVLINPVITRTKLTNVIKTAFIALFFICFMRSSYYIWWPQITNSLVADAYLPNKEIATKITKIWHENFNSKLRYVAGPHYLCAFIAAYSPDKPKPYLSFSTIDSPWINEQDLEKNGAIFVWLVKELSPQEIQELPYLIKQKYPNLKNLGVFKFSKNIKQSVKGNEQNSQLNVIETVDILVAILPPQP